MLSQSKKNSLGPVETWMKLPEIHRLPVCFNVFKRKRQKGEGALGSTTCHLGDGLSLGMPVGAILIRLIGCGRMYQVWVADGILD